MRESIKRIGGFERTSTLRSINAEATIVLGITAKDFMVGILVLLLVSFLPWFYAPFLAVFLAGVFVFLSTRYRKALPPRFLSHTLWSLGLVDSAPLAPRWWCRTLRLLRALHLQPQAPGLPNPFARAKRRFVSFLPQ